MPYTSSEDVSKLLKTPKARYAFTKLSAMNPKWVYCPKEQSIGEGQVYLAPTIEYKREAGDVLISVSAGYAKTADQAVINAYKAFMTIAKKKGFLVIANAYSEDRGAYKADPYTLRFKKVKEPEIKS